MSARATSPLIKPHGLWIDGREVEPAGGTYEKINPATEEVLTHAPNATVGDVRRAIAAARKAFDEGPWPRMSGREREKILTRMAECLERRRDDLIELVIDEAGSSRALSDTLQVTRPIRRLYRYAELASLPNVEALPSRPCGDGPDLTDLLPDVVNHRMIVYEPVGVVGAITGYNFPFFLNLVKLGPALAAGNTVVLKPSPLTPLSALCIPRLIEDADLPPGVLNVVSGIDVEAGRAITTSPLVDMITFTGSVAVGRQIMADAAGTVKKVQLELGGKSALVVLDDADPELAATRGLVTFCAHAGQGCALPTRMLVPRAMLSDVVGRMVKAAKALVIGRPREPGVMVTPLISAAQRERVEGFIRRGIEEGATLACGGKRPNAPARGYFLEPTIFTEVRNDMHIAREEIFGPVQTVIPYDGGDEEAIRIANDSHLGLSGFVLGKDVARGLRIARRLRTGTVAVNDGMFSMVDLPFGGYKQSGLGRENGIVGFREFQEIKAVAWA